MGKKSPKAPSAQQQADAQTATNKETALWNAQLNNVNQITPYGNLTYTQTGGGPSIDYDAYNAAIANHQKQLSGIKNDKYGSMRIAALNKSMPNISDFTTDSAPQYTSTVTLSPEQQQILDSQNRQDISLGQLGEQQIGRIADTVANPYSYGGLQNALPTAEDMMQQQLRAEEAYMSRINPQFAQQEEALRTRLINQGIGQGSQAYQREMDTFNQARNDATSQAVLAGQQYGGTAQNQALQRRLQEIEEYNAQRNAPLNEYIGMTSGTQVMNPQFSSGGNYGNTQPFDIAGAMRNQYSNEAAAANNQNAAMSSLFGMGGQLIGGPVGGFLGSAVGSMFSDKRLKENITPRGHENGFPIYEFSYKGDDRKFTGVMAQDVQEIMPEAVSEVDGFLAVNYPMIGVEMREIV